MKKNKLMSKLISTLLAVGIISTFAMPTKAAEINTKSLTEVKEEFDLKSLDSLDEVPENAKVLKFDTVEQAEKFLKVLESNDDKGNVLDISSIASEKELDNKIIDLSDKKITDENFKKENLSEVKSQSDEEIQTFTYHTSRTGTRSISINGIANMSARCYMRIEWSSSLGNYIAAVTNITSSFTGVTFGNAWTQYGYDYNISNNRKKVTANIHGRYDYYLLINTSLTSIAGKNKSYYFEFNY